MAQPNAIPARENLHPEEEGLVQGLRAGAPEAAQELCARYGPRLYRFAAARLPGDAPAAEDVMAYALTDAAHNIHRFDPRRSGFTAWLFGIAARKLRDAVRVQRRRKSLPPSAQTSMESLAEAAETTDLAETLAARLDAQRQAADLAAVLSNLEFEVLALHCVEELSAREIEAVIGRSERAVHSILHRARQKARERLVHDA